ncbi:uncharacterized protein LOC136749418 [Amia ocellicauda]|uniref:uncharacterized protein LOC136749418 n=1 Tax=Amia ocellicauda TaxID=2972642 RepID=UPI00346438CD
MLPNKLYQQLVHPSKSLLGWVVTRFFLWHHRLAQENAVKLLQIQPDDTVLEVGFGPGLGLRAAAPLLTGPKGKLIGVDYSEYMVSKASQAVKKHIASGKVTLIRGDVVAMPLPDNSIDKVYHCNTSCHWPDLKAATSELHRVMKPEMLAHKINQQLSHPSKSLAGWLATRFFLWHNKVLVKNAVKLLQIQPDDTVLEVGFGPGMGLRAAAPLLTGPKGKLFGVDYSEYKVSMASQRVRNHIASGKISLIRGNVLEMPLPDNSIDKIYHSNCYYYWPDLEAGTSELHRVMKPGALMVTTLIHSSIKKSASRNFLRGNNWQPELYMEALCATGFTDIRMQELMDESITFEAVFATASK